MIKYLMINHEVMTDTMRKCYSINELKDAVESSKAKQFIVAHEDKIEYTGPGKGPKNVTATGYRSFKAAQQYTGKKVAVLNFANNHSIGGSPYYAGAQEESLCRCSTLLPCLESMKYRFYEKHIRQYQKGEINYMGNDDLIYTPDVVVFKTDELTDPIYPELMPKDDWYKVDVITCAAPELHSHTKPIDYEVQITSRIKKILDVAASQGVEVLILGAWGCGAFRNPIDIVARVFSRLVCNYDFEVVEYALSTHGNIGDNAFARALGF